MISVQARYFRKVRPWLLLLTSLWVAPTSAQPLTRPTLVTVYYSERPPFSVVDGQRGYLLERTKAVLAEAGLRGRFIELPADRISDLLRSGADDALGMGWYRTPSREAWGRFSPPLYQERPMVAVVNAKIAGKLPNPVRIDALLASGLFLGVKVGNSFGQTIDQKVRTQGLVPLETLVDIPGLLRLIQSGRMDYTLLAEEEARYHLDRDPGLAAGIVLVRIADLPEGNLRFLFFPAQFRADLASQIEAAIGRLNFAPTPWSP